MRTRVLQIVNVVMRDPAVDSMSAYTGGSGGFSRGINTGTMFITLKSLNERNKMTADQVIARLRGQTARIPGASLFLQPVQDLRIGGRGSAAQYQFTLQSDSVQDLNHWAPIVEHKLRALPEIVDLNSDQQNKGLQTSLVIDRATASRLGISAQLIDDTLYDAFGQRQVSTMYQPLNQYHVVMEASERFWENPDGLKQIYVRGNNGAQVPLSSLHAFRIGYCAAVHKSSGTVSLGDVLVQPAHRRGFGRRSNRYRRNRARGQPAV